MISEQKVEAALDYLNKSSQLYGEVCGLVELRAHNIKIYRSMAFLEAAGTVAEREAKAWVIPTVRTAVDEHADAVAERWTIQTKRKAAELTCEIWRSQNATSRAKVF